MSLDFVLFLILAAVAVAAALAMLFTKNPIYSAIFLILNFSTIAVFYLLLNAPFIAMAQITVYAGAIMVLFLFVIMLLGSEEIQGGRILPWQGPLAVFLGVVLLGEVIVLALTQGADLAPAGPAAEGFGSPSEIGLLLFTDFMLPFQVIGIVLLVALVGAIVITRNEITRPARALRHYTPSGRGTGGNGRGLPAQGDTVLVVDTPPTGRLETETPAVADPAAPGSTPSGES